MKQKGVSIGAFCIFSAYYGKIIVFPYRAHIYIHITYICVHVYIYLSKYMLNYSQHSAHKLLSMAFTFIYLQKGSKNLS